MTAARGIATAAAKAVAAGNSGLLGDVTLAADVGKEAVVKMLVVSKVTYCLTFECVLCQYYCVFVCIYNGCFLFLISK